MCFAEDLNPLELQVILYFNPLLIAILIVLVLVLSRYCSVLVQFQDNTPVKAICLLLLLSFTAMTTTSFNIINPTYINGLNDTFVFIQPTTSYFDAKHLPWFVLAVFVLVVLVLPFTLFLLVSPVLVRCFNLTRVKPFLDEFQSCYKDRFRFMAAYYFICRLCYIGYLTTPVASLYFIQTQYAVQFTSFVFLMIHVFMQPYQSGLLNLIDTILLADIVLVTLLYGETATVVFKDISAFRTMLTYLLVLVPIFIILLLGFFNVWKMFFARRLHNWYTKHFSFRKSSIKVPDSTVATIGEEEPSSRSNNLQEPLLFLLKEHEVHSTRKGHASTVRHNCSLHVQHRPQRTSFTVIDRPWISKSRISSLLSNTEEGDHHLQRGSNSHSCTVSNQEWQDHNASQEGEEL